MSNDYRKWDVARAFGLALRAARVERAISQDTLNAICDVDRTYPSPVERGLRCPTLTMLLRLAHALRVEPALLVTETVRRLTAI
jgi:XRE family transcriptional regulator, regulator of sulfur utilization